MIGIATSYRDFSDEELSHGIGQLHGIRNATDRELLAMTAEHARRKSHRQDGARDTAGWLCQKLGVSLRTGITMAETAIALEHLPHLAETYASGEISFDKVVAVAKLATPDNDEVVAKEAKDASITALEAAARRARVVSTDQEKDIHRKRELRYGWRDGGTRWTLWGSFGAEQGAAIAQSLERIVDQASNKDAEGRFVTVAQRRADALAALATTSIAQDQDSDRATVVLTMDLETARTGMGNGRSQSGGIFSSDVMERILCDACIQPVLCGEDGTPVGVGRTQRIFPPWLARQIALRDLECRWPGCHETKFLQNHHLDHWTRGGRTDLKKGARFCKGTHHPLLHGGGWEVQGDPDGDLVFISPEGKVLHEGPPPLDYDVKKWLWEDLLGELVPSRGPDP